MNHRVLRFGPGMSLLLVALACGSAARAQDATALFKTKCAACHAPDGSGSGPMGKQLGVTDLRSDAIQKETDAQLTDGIANGKGTKMPAYKTKLTDDQIKGLVGYIRTLKK